MLNRLSFRLLVVAVTASLTYSALTLPVRAKSHVSAAAVAPAQKALLTAPKVFVRGSSTLFNPDGIVITKRFVFVIWQNLSDHQPGDTYLVKYDHNGNTLGSVGIVGRGDGLRLDPYTNMLWVTVNNDGLNGHPKRQPYIATVDPRTLATKLYAFPLVQLHGGGYDDIAFVGGQAYLAASNPTLNSAGINDKPIVVKADLTPAGTVVVTPILYGNSVMWDPKANKYDAGNVSDPDSLAIDQSNNLVVVGDNDQELVVIEYPGSKTKQKAARIGYATQFDDVAWTSGGSGTLWVADGATNTIYTIGAAFPYGTVFSETGTGNPIQSFIGTIDGANALTPILTQRDGIFDPTSLEFVPTGGPTDNI